VLAEAAASEIYRPSPGTGVTVRTFESEVVAPWLSVTVTMIE
jgi:hypothetical protein